MYGITFSGKHSWNDFGLYIEEKAISPPAKRKVKETIPGMSGYLDFSTVVSGGEQIYDTREITIKFGLIQGTRENLYSLYTAVLEWLLGAGQSQLIFDFMPGYYFLAEVESTPSWSEFIESGDLEVKFVCNPYKYGVDNYGNLLWDNIDFNLPDYIEETSFNVNGTQNITLYVSGSHSIVPNVITDSSMECTLNGVSVTFTINKSTDWSFRLQPGQNNIQINGTGNIKFNFRKEVL